MITVDNLTQLHIVTLRQELSLIGATSGLTEEQAKLLAACNTAWACFDSPDVVVAKNAICYYLNRRSNPTAVSDVILRQMSDAPTTNPVVGVTAETLTERDVAGLIDSLQGHDGEDYIRELLLDCARVQRAMRIGLGAQHGIPHWYYDTARARVAAAINARAKGAK